jgi:hypothetical protein
MDGIGGDPRYRITADGPGLLLVSLQSGGRSMSGWDDLLAVEMFDEDQDWSVEDGRIWQAGYLSAGRALLTVLPGSTFSWDGQVHDYTLEVRFVPGATAILDEPLRCGEKPSALPVGDTALATFEPDMTVRCFAVETPVAGRLLAHAAESTANGYGSDLQIRIAADRDGLRLDFGREVTAVLEPGTYLLAFDRGYGGARAQFHVGADLVEGAAPPTAETLVLGSAQRIGVARLMADTQGQSTRFAVTIEEPGNLSGVVFGGPRVGISIAAADGYWEQDLPAQVQPGRYTVSVYPREAWPWPFDVQLVLQPGRDGCEPNDDEEEACDLRLDTPQPLMLSSFSDIDWFELTLDRPARVALVLGGVPLPDFDAWGAQVRGVAPDLMVPWAEEPLFHVATNRAWGLLGYLVAPAPGRYRFGISADWFDADPLTPLTLTAMEMILGDGGSIAVFAVGADTPMADRLELELLAGLSGGVFVPPPVEGDALAAAAEAFVAPAASE